MVESSCLIDLLSVSELTNTDRALLCLATEPDNPWSIAELKKNAAEHGFPRANRQNFSQLLARAKGKVLRTSSGWRLTAEGIAYCESIATKVLGGASVVAAKDLRNEVNSLRDEKTRAFMEEAVACYESNLYRAAVVLSWVGAVSVLYDHVVSSNLREFNNEARRRFQKWKPATNQDGLARMKERDFLDVLEGTSVISSSTRKELQTCLDLRNGCGHPSSLAVSDRRAAGHLESLVLNVFQKF